MRARALTIAYDRSHDVHDLHSSSLVNCLLILHSSRRQPRVRVALARRLPLLRLLQAVLGPLDELGSVGASSLRILSPRRYRRYSLEFSPQHIHGM